MKMRAILFHATSLCCALCLLFPMLASAQSIGAAGGIREDTVAKQLFDTALYHVFYDFEFQPDPKEPTWKEVSVALLQVGAKSNAFLDYHAYRSDSIFDRSVKDGVPMMSYFPLVLGEKRLVQFKQRLLLDRGEGKSYCQEAISLSGTYQYEEPIPTFDWEFLSGDTVIAGYTCQKAKVKFRGRDYIAWYSPEFALPYGPYKFSGLPGLIFCLYDTQQHYIFTLAGLRSLHYKDLIYLKEPSRLIKVKRKELQKIYKNHCADPAKSILNSGKKVTISDEDLADIEPLPYNPIELE